MSEVDRGALYRIWPNSSWVSPWWLHTQYPLDQRGTKIEWVTARYLVNHCSATWGEVKWRTLHDEPPEDPRVDEVCAAIVEHVGLGSLVEGKPIPTHFMTCGYCVGTDSWSYRPSCSHCSGTGRVEVEST